MERFWVTIGFFVGVFLFVGYLLGIIDKNGLHWEENQVTAVIQIMQNGQKGVGL